ncbi:MAG: HigA family addiction module antitoxin [Bacteroidetes bacterium]|nr:HigA family addiction module antitoxin [Bacteroidota bacterium]
MYQLRNIHPGEVLQEEFLIPMEITAYRLSLDIGIPQTRISEIVKGHRRITADTAIRLSNYFGNSAKFWLGHFGNSAKFWLGLQNDYDVEEEMNKKANDFKAIKKHKSNIIYK